MPDQSLFKVCNVHALYVLYDLKIIFYSIPLWEGCLVTGIDTFTFLFLESYGKIDCSLRLD